jgi:hypothetical protein
MYAPDVLSVSDVCCIQVFYVALVSCCSESRAVRGSDGGTALAPGNGAWQAGGRWTWRAAHWGPVVGGTMARGASTGQGERMGQGARMGAGRIEADGAGCEPVTDVTMAQCMQAGRISRGGQVVQARAGNGRRTESCPVGRPGASTSQTKSGSDNQYP